MTEWFDEVDCNDKVIGKVSREDAHTYKIRHRAVHIFLQKSTNQWILQKRSFKKDTEPLTWTSSCSGHVDAAESYLDAAVRECREELGLQINRNEFIELLRCSPSEETGMEFIRIYYVERNFPCVFPDYAEIQEISSKSIFEISSDIEVKKKNFSRSFIYIFQLLHSKLSSLEER